MSEYQRCSETWKMIGIVTLITVAILLIFWFAFSFLRPVGHS